MNSGPLRIALIGAGGIGKTHLARYALIPEAIVVAVCDPVEAAAHTAAQQVGAATYSDVETMLEQEDLQAVDICTPTAFHTAPAIKAMERGLHVLCEKPLAHEPDAARQMVQKAEQQGVLLMTAFCHRFHPPIAAIKRLIQDGEMGTVAMFRNRFAGPAPGIKESWFSRKEIAGGGALLDTSIHSIDLFRFLVGEVENVHAVMRRTDPVITEVEDTAMAMLSTADRRMGVIESSWSLAGGYNVVEVYGTQGAAMVHYWDGQSSRYRTNQMSEWKPLEESGPDRFAAEIRHFVEACLGRTALQVTGWDGLRAVEIAADAYRSAGW